MAKKKFYAIRKPIGPKIEDQWEECASLVIGVSGARFKSFLDRQAAEEWLLQEEHTPLHQGLRIYVDGSFIADNAHGGWAIAAVRDDQLLWTLSGITDEAALSRNIDGEVEAAARAIEWLRLNPQPATLCYDYEGIARWAQGDWKAVSYVAKRYVERVIPLPTHLRFEKIRAHTGDQWNELVDELARRSLTEMKKSL